MRNLLKSRILTAYEACRTRRQMVRPARLVLLLFIVAQACDGVFTYVAVSAFGLEAEGNVLLATWMSVIGPAPALLGAKLLALACGVLLYVRGVHRVLAALTAFYAVGAVGPWLVFLNRL